MAWEEEESLCRDMCNSSTCLPATLTLEGCLLDGERHQQYYILAWGSSCLGGAGWRWAQHRSAKLTWLFLVGLTSGTSCWERWEGREGAAQVRRKA